MAGARNTHPLVITLDTDAELAEAEALHRLIHGETAQWDDLLRRDPDWGAPGVHRAVRADGRLVSLASMATTRQRFGDTNLKVGEIGLVGTALNRRNEGFSRALMESWLATMRTEHYALSYLFGISGFYERWHYHYAAPDHVYPYLTVERRMLERGGEGHEGARVRALDGERDLAAVMALAEDDLAGVPCSPVRSTATWRFLFNAADRHGVDWVVVEGQDGALIGYARLKRWRGGTSMHPAGAVTDVAVATEAAGREAACRALSRHLLGHLDAGLGGESGEAAATATLPLCIAPHGRFGEWLYRHGARRGCDNQIYPGSWAAMYRVVDLPAVLEAWRSDWGRRLAQAAPLPPLALTLRSGDDGAGVATLALDAGGIDIVPGPGGTEVEAPPDVVVPWLTGWRSAAEWLAAAPPTLAPAERRLLALLFPERHPWIGDTYQG